MKTKFASLLLLALAGCVPSWNPFYTEEDLIFDATLTGSWRPAGTGENSTENWAFIRAGGKLYHLTQTDAEGRQATFEARLFKLREHRFLDLYLTKIEGDNLQVNSWANLSLVPAHLLLKVEQTQPSLKLAAMNPDWVRRFLVQHPEALVHRVVGDGSVILAAGTAELQRFILDHLADEDFFGGAMEMTRKLEGTAADRSAPAGVGRFDTRYARAVTSCP